MDEQIHLTVAAVIEKENKFLFVAELCGGELRINQPAGHVEAGETISAACIRECFEETGWRVEPTALLSLSTYRAPSNGVTYHRVCFAARPTSFDTEAELDADIDHTLWLSKDEFEACGIPLRSPLVAQALDDYLNGEHYPLSFLRE